LVDLLSLAASDDAAFCVEGRCIPHLGFTPVRVLPISPLLANLYMRRVVLGWKMLGLVIASMIAVVVIGFGGPRRSFNLDHANLSGQNLRQNDLRSANLGGANLSGATLTDANLSGAALTGGNKNKRDRI
jgi:hypothetical protein